MSPNLTAIRRGTDTRYCVECGSRLETVRQRKFRLCARCIKKTVLSAGRCR